MRARSFNFTRIHLGALLVLMLGAWRAEAEDTAQPAVPKFADEAASRTEFDRSVATFFTQHCRECHNAEKSEGELNLAELNPDMKLSASAGRWAMVLEKIAAREMPPEAKPRPSEASLRDVVTWIHAEMKRANKRVAHRAAYSNGNSVSHELLFDPKQAAPFDSPPRIRRLSPEIYEALTKDLAKDVNVGQPFSPEGRSIFLDSGAPKIDEPVASLLLSNALAMIEKQTNFKIENGEIKGNMPKEIARLFDEKTPLTNELIAAALKAQFDRVLKRPPTADEAARFAEFLQQNVRDSDRVIGVRYALAAVYVLPEAVFRFEVGGAAADDQGRARLTGREIAYAITYALADSRPENSLLNDAAAGKLDTREGVAAAVEKMLADTKFQKPRIMRFFREYFGYARASEVFKDEKLHKAHDSRAIIDDTDRLIETILAADQNVLEELLTTTKSFVAHKSGAETKKRRAEELVKFEESKKKDPKKYASKTPPQFGRSVYEVYNLPDFPDQQPVELPAEQRSGVLTQPAWLVAWSQSDDNHAILRGKWVRERLLGGVVPDVPITVDAQLPIAPEKTLRERMEVTRQEYCWKCHQLMNPVGFPFEMYDHLGRYRTEELGKPVNAAGAVDQTGYAGHEGNVTNAVDMLHKLAKSERVEQVFVRYAFRYWMGRNETLGDGATLQAAHKAYKESGGSMQALVVSLLTSDSFLYRERLKEKDEG